MPSTAQSVSRKRKFSRWSSNLLRAANTIRAMRSSTLARGSTFQGERWKPVFVRSTAPSLVVRAILRATCSLER